MQADTGTKMIHLGKNTDQQLLQGILLINPQHLRGLLKSGSCRECAQLYACDSMLVGNRCFAKYLSDH